ncbi:MAG: O-methyltransferase [Eubacteriales bacterium]|nr:O-methyltransferase [Eubacteriales bacterium]
MNPILSQVLASARDRHVPVIDDDSREILIRAVEEVKPRRILEIGTAIGYSASLMALSSEATIDTVEMDDTRRQEAISLWKRLGIDDRIHAYLGNADEILESVVEGKEYDFIFIDGPKSKYLSHFLICLPHLSAGGVVFADDVLYFGMVEGEEFIPHKHRTIVTNLRQFLATVQTDERLECTIVREGNGVAIIRKK